MADFNIFYMDKNKPEAPKFKELFTKARKELDLADHLVYVTFPLVNELKFLIAITEHLVIANQQAMEALLEYERYYKRIEPYPKNFSAMLTLFNDKLADKYNFDRKYYNFLKRLIELQLFISESSMKFKRNNKYILTSNIYDIKTIDLGTIKKHLELSKQFLDKIETILKSEV